MAEERSTADDEPKPGQPLVHSLVREPFEAGRSLQRSATPARRGRRVGDDPVSLGLRKLWQDVEHEPVPEEFLDLLDAIDAVRAPGDASSGSSGTSPADEPVSLSVVPTDEGKPSGGGQ